MRVRKIGVSFTVKPVAILRNRGVAVALLNGTASQIVMFSFFLPFRLFYPSQSLLNLTIRFSGCLGFFGVYSPH